MDPKYMQVLEHCKKVTLINNDVSYNSCMVKLSYDWRKKYIRKPSF